MGLQFALGDTVGARAASGICWSQRVARARCCRGAYATVPTHCYICLNHCLHHLCSPAIICCSPACARRSSSTIFSSPCLTNPANLVVAATVCCASFATDHSQKATLNRHSCEFLLLTDIGCCKCGYIRWQLDPSTRSPQRGVRCGRTTESAVPLQVRANCEIPPSSGVFYFEVTLLSPVH